MAALSGLTPKKNDFTIAVAREIRQYRNLSFDHIGTIIIYVNMEKLVGDILEGSSKIDGEVLIKSNDDNLIFPKETSIPFKEIAKTLDTGYQIKKINQKNYFIVHIKSNYFDWSYLNVIPFNQIFENINKVKTFLIIIFILMFVVVSILGMRFAKSITSPLENLVAGMQYVKVGDFKEASREALKTSIHKMMRWVNCNKTSRP